jgi:predicted SAM-dependent methyltransferase
MIFTERFVQVLKRSELLVSLVRGIRRGIRRAKWLVDRPHLIKSYLDSNSLRKLQIGAWTHVLEGWLNTDCLLPPGKRVLFLDAAQRFPFENCTFDYIFSEHQIEHISYREGVFMISECFRVLKPGGKLRISTPDLKFYVNLAVPNKSAFQIEYIKWVTDAFIRTGFHRAKEYIPPQGVYIESFVINDIFLNYDHKFIYDRETLKSLMEEVGFINITNYRPGESDDENLRNIESCTKGMAYMGTMVLEGKRPE